MFPNQRSTIDWSIYKRNMINDLKTIGIKSLTITVRSVGKAFYSGTMSPIGFAMRAGKSLYYLRPVEDVDGLSIGCNGRSCQIFRE